MARTRRSVRFRQLTAKAISARRLERARTCPACSYPILVYAHGFGQKGFYRVFDDGCKVVQIFGRDEFNPHTAVAAYAEQRVREAKAREILFSKVNKAMKWGNAGRQL